MTAVVIILRSQITCLAIRVKGILKLNIFKIMIVFNGF